MKRTIQRIEKIIKKEKHTTAKQLIEELNVSQVLVHRHLKTLCERNIIKKIGSAPKVYYIYSVYSEKDGISISSDIIKNNWLEILPNGSFLYGNDGFISWCKKRNCNVFEKQKLYEKIYFEKELLKKENLIDASNKITESFERNYLEKLWYVDFYSWEIFGKTLLGKLILYAKQNSDIELMKKIASIIERPIQNLINKYKFDMIVRIPHSVPRKRDFLKSTLNFSSITTKSKTIFDKVFAGHSVAQKTLKLKSERQRNAEETLFLNEKNLPKKILLLDDACGSGSTLNIAAQKIKKVSPKTKVFGLAFVGSINGFDVISEI